MEYRMDPNSPAPLHHPILLWRDQCGLRRLRIRGMFLTLICCAEASCAETIPAVLSRGCCA